MVETIEKNAKKGKKALVVGIGGGGDIVGSLPTYNYLKKLNTHPIAGGLTWERSVNDPKPGPRKINEIKNIRKISKTTAMANENTETEDGIIPTESVVAQILEEKTLLVDLNYGVKGLIQGFNATIDELNIDFVIGVDVGGDVLARGDEKGLKSMLADSMFLSALNNLKTPAILGVLGLGVDGELEQELLLEYSAEIASAGGLLGARGITPDDIQILAPAVGNTTTESSALALKAAKGEMGKFKIREEQREVKLSPVSAITFYYDPETVMEKTNKISKKLAKTKNIDAAQKILEDKGIPTELNYERNINEKDEN